MLFADICAELIPRIASGTTTSSIMEALLTMLLSERFGALAGEASKTKRSPDAEAMRAKIRQDIEKHSDTEAKKK